MQLHSLPYSTTLAGNAQVYALRLHGKPTLVLYAY